MSEPTERPILFSGDMIKALINGNKTQTRRPVKPQPYRSSSNPPFFTDTAVGDIFICPDMFPTTDTQGYVIVECEAVGVYHSMGQQQFAEKHSPFGVPGDRLWVRETFLPDPPRDHDAWDDWTCTSFEWEGCGSKLNAIPTQLRSPKHCLYQASWNGSDLCWRPSIHMPKWASRLTLEVVKVSVERLQAISVDDVAKEGVPFYCGCPSASRDEDYTAGVTAYAREKFSIQWNDIYAKQGLCWASNPWVWRVEFKRVGA